jgi:hypothetical protein
MNIDKSESAVFIPYRAHPKLAEFTEIYLELEGAVEGAIAARSAWNQASSERIAWEVFARKFPANADKESDAGKKFHALMVKRERVAARAETLWVVAPNVLYQARGKMEHIGLAKLSRQFGETAEAKSINATFSPYASRNSHNIYNSTALPHGLTLAEYEAIQEEPHWNLPEPECNIAINNFICGVNLEKRAVRVYDKVSREAFYSLKINRLGTCYSAELKEALTFYQTLGALRGPYSETEALADF